MKHDITHLLQLTQSCIAVFTKALPSLIYRASCNEYFNIFCMPVLDFPNIFLSKFCKHSSFPPYEIQAPPVFPCCFNYSPKIFVYFITVVWDCTLEMRPQNFRSPNLTIFFCLLQDNKHVLKLLNLPCLSICERGLTGVWYFQVLIKFSSRHLIPY